MDKRDLNQIEAQYTCRGDCHIVLIYQFSRIGKKEDRRLITNLFFASETYAKALVEAINSCG